MTEAGTVKQSAIVVEGCRTVYDFMPAVAVAITAGHPVGTFAPEALTFGSITAHPAFFELHAVPVVRTNKCA